MDRLYTNRHITSELTWICWHSWIHRPEINPFRSLSHSNPIQWHNTAM